MVDENYLGRRIDDTDALPSQRPARSWRTREEPLTQVWDGEVVPLLRTDPLLNAVTLLEELQRRHPACCHSLAGPLSVGDKMVHKVVDNPVAAQNNGQND